MVVIREPPGSCFSGFIYLLLIISLILRNCNRGYQSQWDTWRKARVAPPVGSYCFL